MKKIYYSTIILALLICFSCKKENNIESTQAETHSNTNTEDETSNKAIEINTSNQPLDIQLKKITDSISNKKYFLVKQENCDLNKDNLIDIILVFDYIEDVNPNDSANRKSPIVVLLNKSNKYQININYNIFPNTYGDGYKNIIIKEKYFTIELINEVPNYNLTEKYITFKFDNKTSKIILHKYGENTEWSDESKPSSELFDMKKFGIIEFKDYDSNTIRDIANGK